MEKECKKHGLTRFRRDSGCWRCVKCATGYVQALRNRHKALLVEEWGGSCEVCGYAKSLAALHFHHLDPSIKSFTLSNTNLGSPMNKLREEAKKCQLLCANCHAEVEYGVVAER